MGGSPSAFLPRPLKTGAASFDKSKSLIARQVFNGIQRCGGGTPNLGTIEAPELNVSLKTHFFHSIRFSSGRRSPNGEHAAEPNPGLRYFHVAPAVRAVCAWEPHFQRC